MRKTRKVPNFDTLDKGNLSQTLLDADMMGRIVSFNERYLHWDEIGFRVDECDRNDCWVAMKILRAATARPVAIGDIDITFNLTPEMQMMLHDIDRRTRKVVCPYDDIRYRISSVMEEAIASSQMEGSDTARDRAKSMLRRDVPVRTVGDRMILNNYRTMEFIRDNLDREMTPDLILRMHRMITDGLLDGWEGRLREDDDTVVGDPLDEGVNYHQPPEHGRLPSIMQSLCDFVNSNEYIHPVVKGIMIHFLIGHIHPFRDGNGRLARSMFYWYVMKEGYDLLGYTSVSRIIGRSRSGYNDAYQFSESDDNDVTYFIRYNLECIVEAIDELEDYVRRKTDELDEGMLHIDPSDAMNHNEMMIINDYGRTGRKFTIKEISRRYGFAYQSARNYVNRLLELGRIEEAGKERKTVLYAVISK